jgi:hypothetical protein
MLLVTPTQVSTCSEKYILRVALGEVGISSEQRNAEIARH